MTKVIIARLRQSILAATTDADFNALYMVFEAIATSHLTPDDKYELFNTNGLLTRILDAAAAIENPSQTLEKNITLVVSETLEFLADEKNPPDLFKTHYQLLANYTLKLTYNAGNWTYHLAPGITVDNIKDFLKAYKRSLSASDNNSLDPSLAVIVEELIPIIAGLSLEQNIAPELRQLLNFLLSKEGLSDPAQQQVNLLFAEIYWRSYRNAGAQADLILLLTSMPLSLTSLRVIWANLKLILGRSTPELLHLLRVATQEEKISPFYQTAVTILMGYCREPRPSSDSEEICDLFACCSTPYFELLAEVINSNPDLEHPWQDSSASEATDTFAYPYSEYVLRVWTMDRPAKIDDIALAGSYIRFLSAINRCGEAIKFMQLANAHEKIPDKNRARTNGNLGHLLRFFFYEAAIEAFFKACIDIKDKLASENTAELRCWQESIKTLFCTATTCRNPNYLPLALNPLVDKLLDQLKQKDEALAKAVLRALLARLHYPRFEGDDDWSREENMLDYMLSRIYAVLVNSAETLKLNSEEIQPLIDFLGEYKNHSKKSEETLVIMGQAILKLLSIKDIAFTDAQIERIVGHKAKALISKGLDALPEAEKKEYLDRILPSAKDKTAAAQQDPLYRVYRTRTGLLKPSENRKRTHLAGVREMRDALFSRPSVGIVPSAGAVAPTHDGSDGVGAVTSTHGVVAFLPNL